MSAYATDDKLVALVPDIFNHGVESFEPELLRSTGDIQRRIKTEWWSIDNDPNLFDTTKLKASEWERATIYHALSYYILPRLSNFQDGDSFTNQMNFYRDRYQEEFSAAFAAGISYDDDGDGSFSASEVEYIKSERLYR
jgi:hypothetical protein